MQITKTPLTAGCLNKIKEKKHTTYKKHNQIGGGLNDDD